MPEKVIARNTYDDQPVQEGLAAVDLSSAANGASRSSSRFEEYKVDGEEEMSMGTPTVENSGVEVVRVKRKKKKEGGKRRVQG